MLPPALRLAGGSRVDVLVVFGDHEGSTVHWSAMHLRTGVRFREVLFGVRCVLASSGASVLYVPAMYCDEPVSTWSGNALYGFNKRPATMEWVGGSFAVLESDGRVLLQTTLGPDDTACVDGRPFLELAHLAIVGRRQDGSYVGSRFEWHWPTGHARSVKAVLAVDDPALPGFGSSPLYVAPGRAVLIENLVWRLSWPDPFAIDRPRVNLPDQ